MLTALIVGASRGIGLAFANQYAASGWRVIATCRSAKGADALKMDNVEVARCDVTDVSSIEELASALADTAIDHLVFNAGVQGPREYTLSNFDEAAWIEVMRVNAIAPLRFAHHFVDHVARSERRIMAFVSSRRGSMSENNWGGHYIYGSSKAALNYVVKSLSIDLEPKHVTCIALTPGWVRTDMGGDKAPIDANTSAKGMVDILNRAGPAENGRFFQFDGREVPW